MNATTLSRWMPRFAFTHLILRPPWSPAVYCVQRASVAAIAVLLMSIAAVSNAAFIVGSLDARTEYPAYPAGAPVVTAELPTGTPMGIGNRAAGSERIMAQTFQVAEPINLESIYLAYGWLQDNSETATFRLLQVPDVDALYDLGTVTVLGSPLTVSFGAEPDPDPTNNPDRVYALRLDWTGPTQTLLPLGGSAGYAIEARGSGTNAAAPIGIIRYTADQYANGSFLEQNSAGTAAPVNGAGDMAVAVTGIVIPEPTSLLLLAGSVLIAAVRGRRRRRN